MRLSSCRGFELLLLGWPITTAPTCCWALRRCESKKGRLTPQVSKEYLYLGSLEEHLILTLRAIWCEREAGGEAAVWNDIAGSGFTTIETGVGVPRQKAAESVGSEAARS